MPEIERKFRLSAPPYLEILGKGSLILQGYIFTDREGELRLRRKGTKNYITVKGNGTLVREEWERELPEDIFNLLWPHTEGRRVEKIRYEVDGVEVDVYWGGLRGLVILECEFPSETDAADFCLPVWAENAVEVTEDSAYKNKNLAVNGLPSQEGS